MMLDGKIVYEASGEEKKNLKVQDLLEKFQVAGGEESVPDRMILG
jgi:putative ABC transport system ATP-binding protein